LVVKEELLNKLNAYTLTGDAATDKENLRKFSEEWTAAGMVPFKEKQRLNDGFYKRLDELYDSVITNQSEKFLLKFTNKLERFKTASDSETLFKKEKDFLRKNIDEIVNNIRTYENNMGFFKNAKGKNDFITEIENKVEHEKAKLKDFKDRMKLLSDAMDSMRVSS
jgi:predicted DNA-binding protein YlxM (UPF0122 family)